MAHQLEILGNTRESASFVSAREHAWHKLGTVLPETFNAAQAMEHAKLGGWDVRKMALQVAPVIDVDGVSPAIDVPDQFATVRTHPVTGRVDVLGVVGAGYRPIQNEAHADLLDALVNESGAHFETAGSLRGGREVFLSMKLPQSMTIAGLDSERIDLYVVALNSHDGTSAFRFLISPVRVVCANTQAAAIATAKSSFSIRHTAGAAANIATAREALGMTWKYAEAFQVEAEKMIERTVTDEQFAQIVAKVWPTEATTKRTHAADDRLRELRTVRRDSLTISETIRPTAWGAYQAVTEWVDFVSPMRAKAAGQAERAERAVTGTGPAAKARAFDLLAAV